MKNDGQPIRDSVPLNSQCTKDPRKFNNVFLFSTEIWAKQLKKHPVYILASGGAENKFFEAGGEGVNTYVMYPKCWGRAANPFPGRGGVGCYSD